MDQSDRLNALLPQPKIESLPSRANSLRAYAENLLESDNTTLADEEISGLVDDLIEFAEQWEAELQALRLKPIEDAAGILIRPKVKVE